MKVDIFAEDKPAEISVVESTQPLRLTRQSKDN